MYPIKTIAAVLLAMTTVPVIAQNIDFDLPGKTAPGKDTEINYISWAVPRAASDTKTLDNGMTLTISAGGAATDVGSNWSKTDVETKGLRVIGDEVLATHLERGNLTKISDASTSLILTITGMTTGQHTLKAYHNNSDANQTQPDIEVSVDGRVVVTGAKFTSAAQSTLEAGSSFVTFNVTEGQPVVITYRTVLEDGKTYTDTRAMINGLERLAQRTDVQVLWQTGKKYCHDEAIAAINDAFDLFLGDNLQGRKDYISQNGHLYIEMADLS